MSWKNQYLEIKEGSLANKKSNIAKTGLTYTLKDQEPKKSGKFENSLVATIIAPDQKEIDVYVTPIDVRNMLQFSKFVFVTEIERGQVVTHVKKA